MMADKRLIVAVEGTASMGPFWQTILHDYLEKIIRCFCSTELTGQKQSAPNVELSLVVFNSHGSYSACVVQRSGWTKDADIFFQWLSAIPFTGGGFNDAAVTEGLAEALMMFSYQNENQAQQNMDGQRHCILVAASNPYSLPTPVYRPQLNVEKSESIESQAESRLLDAEAAAKFFPQCSVSLSVISPKQFPKLRAIYNAGKRNPRVPDPLIDNTKNPYYLVLISEFFMEARAALSRPGMANLVPNLPPVKMDVTPVPVSSPPSTTIPSANASIMSRQPIPVSNIIPATVKVEPNIGPSMVSAPSFPHIPSVPRAVSQGVPSLQTSSPLPASQEMIPSSENVQDLKPTVNGTTQSLRPVGPAAANVSILNNLSQARQVMNSAALAGGTSMGLQPMGGTPMAMHMSNMISSGMSSSPPPAQTVLPSGQSGLTSMAGSGTIAATAQNSSPATFASATSNMSGNSNLGMSQPPGNLQGGNLQGGVSMGQSVAGMGQGNLSGAQMIQSGISMNQNMMSGMGTSGISSGTGSMMPTPGMGQQVQPGMQSLGVNNNGAANMPLSQQSSGAMTSAQSKYVKVWEGNLSGQRQGQPVFITRLEGYRSASASETLAANWPPTMQIVRLISQDHMNNKQYVGKADFLVFRAMNQHGFLGQLQEKKLCAVIQLPSQTLLLSVSDKACRLIGMLFPGDMVVFKPQIANQPPPQHPQLNPQQLQQLQQQHQQQHHHQQQQQQQQNPQQQQIPQQQQHMPQMQQQQQPQQQQMVGASMGQGYVQQGRPQLVNQGQVPSQGGGAPGMSGGGYLN